MSDGPFSSLKPLDWVSMVATMAFVPLPALPDELPAIHLQLDIPSRNGLDHRFSMLPMRPSSRDSRNEA